MRFAQCSCSKLVLVTLLVVSSVTITSRGSRPDVTTILHLAEFDREVMVTGHADDTNRLDKVTVVAVDDAHMAHLKKARDDLPPQVSGDRPAVSAGSAKIDHPGLQRTSGIRDDQEGPYIYNISILQVSRVISSQAAGSLESSPSPHTLWDVMLKNGCGRFADLVSTTANAGAAYTYDSGDVDDGLTAFCPADMVMEEFEPTLKEHKAGARLKLLLYHGLRAHYSIRALKVNNGPMNTLATDEKERYILMVDNDGDNVTLLSAARKPAVVVRTLMDANRVAVHMIDGVLLPNEFAEFGPAYANAPPGGKDGAMEGNQKNGATGSPLIVLFASTAGEIACWVFVVWVSAF